MTDLGIKLKLYIDNNFKGIQIPKDLYLINYINFSDPSVKGGGERNPVFKIIFSDDFKKLDNFEELSKDITIEAVEEWYQQNKATVDFSINSFNDKKKDKQPFIKLLNILKSNNIITEKNKKDILDDFVAL